MEHRVSVIMSVYNEKIEWLKEAVSSILNQSFVDFEFIIIVDNPNIDLTIKEYLSECALKDNRIAIYYNKRNIGLAFSLNKAIKLAKGEYIARMDADDISLPYRLEKEIEFLTQENADMVSTNAVIIDEDSKEKYKLPSVKKDPTYELRYTNVIIHPTVLIKRDVLESVGGYRGFRRSQDYDLWLRLLSEGWKIRILDQTLLKYRVRETSITNTGRLEQYYTNLYQQKLFIERRKRGKDSFSLSNYSNFIKSQKITKDKNERCMKCILLLNKSKDLLAKRKILGVKYYFEAWFQFPSIATRSFIRMIHKELKI